MGDKNKLKALFDSPDFRSLPYFEQVRVRFGVLPKYFADDPTFQELPDEEKNRVINTIARFPPKFENKEFDSLVTELADSAKAGDREAHEIMRNIFFSQGGVNSGMVINGLSRLVTALRRKDDRPMSPEEAEIQVSLGMDPLLIKNVQKYSKFGDFNFLVGNDGDKFRAYVLGTKDIAGARTATVQRQAKTMGTIGAMAGMGIDFAAWNVLYAATAGPMIAGLFAKAATETTGRLAPYIVSRVLPQIVSAFSEGVFFVGQSNAMGVLAKDPKKFTTDFKKTAATFGLGMALDFTMGMVGEGVTAAIGSIGKNVFLKRNPKPSRLTTDEFISVVEDQVGSGKVADVFKEMSDSKFQFDLDEQRYVLQKAVDNGFEITNKQPMEKAMLEARQSGMVFGGSLDTGEFRVYKVGENNLKLGKKKFRSLWEAKKYMSETVLDDFVTGSQELKDAFLNDPIKADMLKQAKAGRVIQSLYDPTFTPDMSKSQRSRLLKKAGAEMPEPYRPYITRAEADAHLASRTDAVAAEVKLDIGYEDLSKLKKFDDLYSGKNTVRFARAATEDTKGMLFIKNPAPETAYKSAEALSKVMVSNDPRIGSIGENISDLLSHQGYDGYVHMDGTLETFFPENVKVIYGKGFREVGRVFKSGGEINSLGAIKATFNKAVSPEVVQADKQVLSAVATKTFSGTVNPEEVKTFAHIMTKGSKKPYTSMSVMFSNTNPGASLAADGSIVVTIPKTINNPGIQADVIEKVVGDLTALRRGEPLKAKELASFMKEYGKTRVRMTRIFDNPMQQKTWLNDVAMDTLQIGGLAEMPDGSFSMVLRDGRKMSFKTIDDATDFVAMAGMGYEGIKTDLKFQGYNLTRNPNGFVVTGPSLSKPIKSETLNGILDKLEYRPKKLDSRFAPVTARLTNTGETILTYEGHVAVGDRRSVLKMLSRFENKKEKELLRILKIKQDGTISINQAGTFELEIPEIGYHNTFDTLYEAAHFADNWWKETDGVMSVASHKGFTFHLAEGQLSMIDSYTGVAYPVKDFDQVKQVLAQFPDPIGAREILDELIPGISDDIGQAILAGKKYRFPPQTAKIPLDYESAISPQEVSTKSLRESILEASKLTRQTDYYMERHAKLFGRDNILKQYRDVEIGRRIADTKIYELTDLLENQVFTLRSGKKMRPNRRKALYYYMSAQSPEEFARFKKVFKFEDLSVEEVEASVRLRGVFNKLSKVFNIDSDKMIFNYMPRLAKHFRQFGTKKGFDFMSELVDDMFIGADGKTVPSELKAWFKNDRVSEFLSFSAKDDAFLVTLQYIQQGYKKKYMEEAWKTLYDGMKETGDPDLFKYMNRYREKLMGSYNSSGEVLMQRIGEHFYNALGKVFPGVRGKTGADFMNAVFNLNYTVNLGMKPFLAIRNALQVYTMLGSRFGLLPVDRAIKEMLNVTPEFFEGLKRLGIISGNPPVLGTINKFNSGLGKFTDKMMTWFKNSDEFSRAVAYKTTKNMWNDAVDRVKRGVIKSPEQFAKASGLDLMDKEVQERCIALAMKGDIKSVEAGGDYFAFRVQEETMFGYRTSQAPYTRDGVMGKLFGTYGTYPVGYRANIARALSNGNAGQKAAFVGRFLAINGALFSAFKAAQIKSPDFIPGLSAIFTGGPMLDMVYTGIQGMDPSSYEGRQARGELLNYLKSLGPLSPYVRYAKKSIKYFEEGDYYKAFLSATMTPTYDEN